MNVSNATLPGIVVIEPPVFADDRGFFLETWHQVRYQKCGLPANFVQDNLSFSVYGTLRGLHFQHPNDQGKLVYVLQGEIFDVAVDIRVGSQTFGQWASIVLSETNKLQVYVPEGFAHGFCVTSKNALVGYKCTDFYNPTTEGGVLWNDPALGIPWPVATPTLSEKDRAYPRLQEISLRRLPQFSPPI
jgi:dTDP-4-dehydrorhamnose 3,5-epimerase